MSKNDFYLDKWFLDFVNPEGDAMIFYAAKLSWRGLTVPYTSWLSHSPRGGVSQKSRFRNVQMPERKDNLISWGDPKFGINGTWKTQAGPLKARLFDSKEGHLDWQCFQPASEVRLQINGTTLVGSGYAEQLILTAPPWHIPMDELRWGRFGSDEDHLVWIEIREADNRQWLWLNGERIEHCIIEDDQITLPDAVLRLDRKVTLESEKNIFSVVENILSYLPGFNKVMPLHFLMADSFKWLSNGQLQRKGEAAIKGAAIHEFVNFKAE